MIKLGNFSGRFLLSDKICHATQKLDEFLVSHISQSK